jgi:prolyl 4-hydroxylase
MLNSSGTFLGANEDPTGTLVEVEKKVERATMIPRNHGEVLLCQAC